MKINSNEGNTNNEIKEIVSEKDEQNIMVEKNNFLIMIIYKIIKRMYHLFYLFWTGKM